MFLRFGYEWKIGDRSRVPTEKDLEQTLDKMKERLYAEPTPRQMELGRIILIHHEPGKFDVYLHLGEYND